MAKGMSPAELTDLEVYAQKDLQASSSMSDVQNNVSLDDRKAALKEMLTGNPFATNRMMSLMKKDAQAESADTILVTGGVMFELYPYRSVMTDGLPADPVEAEALIDGILGVLAKDEARLQNTEALMATDDFVAASYILHVDGDNESLYYLNKDALYQDAAKGTFKTTNADVTAKLETLLADVPKAPEETTPDETAPDETEPGETKPLQPSESITDALKNYLTGKKIEDSLHEEYIESYVENGSGGNTIYNRELETYVAAGNIDGELENLLHQYKTDKSGIQNAALVTMLDNFHNGTGNTVLNARLKLVEEQMTGSTEPTEESTEPTEETTKPTEETTEPTEKTTEPTGETTEPTEETKSPEEQMKEMVVKEFLEYWEKGPAKDDPIDAMFEEYIKTGKFDLSGTGFEDKVPDGLDKEIDSYMGQAVSLALYNYLSRGLEEDKYYSELMNKYFTFGGNSGYPYLDDKTDALIESGTVNTLLSRLIVTYRKAGKTGHDVMDGLFKKYEDKKINSTGIWPLDKALKEIYFELLTASTQQAAQQASAGIARDNHLYFSVYLNYKEELAMPADACWAACWVEAVRSSK